MRRRVPALVASVITAAAVAFGAHAAGAYSGSDDSQPQPQSLPQQLLQPVASVLRALRGTAPACADVPAPRAHCLSHYLLDASPQVAQEGWKAADIAAAYRLPVTEDPHQTVAVSIAYDNPRLESDLAAYRQANHLPACTSANGCFRKVAQNGAASPLPQASNSWGIESTLDVQMLSASCPKCRILVVESNSDRITDLAAGVDTAARLGANVISASYGVNEYGWMSGTGAHFNHPGHPVVASAGDTGYTTALFPAVTSGVTAVGGTTLNHGTNPRGWAESAWGGDTSACSAYVAKPSWQHDSGCGRRTVADISAVAANLSIYDTYQRNGWMQVDGTSAAAPIVAGAIALSGGASTYTPQRLYQKASLLYDVTTGTNDSSGSGSACNHDYRCVAKRGYDAPTGLGSPNGTAAFAR